MTGDVECSSGLAYRSAYHKALSVIDKAIRIDKAVMPPPPTLEEGQHGKHNLQSRYQISIITSFSILALIL